MNRLLVFLLLAACNPEKKENLEKLEALEAAIAGFESWDQLPDWQGVQPSLDGTHGETVQIWVDDAFLETVTAATSGEMPVGAIAVKVGYKDEEGTEFNQRVAHQRQADGTLFFARWDEDDVADQFGRPDLCVDCHRLGQDEIMAVEW